MHVFVAQDHYGKPHPALQARRNDVADAVEMLPSGMPSSLARELVIAIRRTPRVFTGFNTNS